MCIGDRIAVLNGGRLEQIGTPEAVYHLPASRFVAEFMGHTGFLPGRVVPGGIETEIGPARQPVGHPVGATVQVVVRPDDVMLMADGAAERVAAGVAGRVAGQVFQGMHRLYRVALPSGRFVDCLAPHTQVHATGAVVRVVLMPGHSLASFAD